MAEPTLSLTCTIAETGTKEAYNRDPRGIAQRGEKYLQSTGLADAAVFGPEAEFFIFDNVQFDHKSNGTFYSVDSEEAVWNTGREEMPNLGNKIRHKEGYFPVAPVDTQQDIRAEMCLSWRNWASRSSASIMKWPRRARRRLISASTPWSRRLTT
jgi:glutamine synthetase